MPRPRADGTPPAPRAKQKLNHLFLSRLKPQPRAYLVWDTYQRGLVIRVRPTGAKSWNVVYTRNGRPRWYYLGDAAAIGLSDARTLAGRIMFAVAEGKDPAAERVAHRSKGTFEELAARYVEEHAKKHNKSWKQADALVRKRLLPRWGKLEATNISRADVKALMTSITAPITANQTLAAASAIFAWAISEEVVKVNPCTLVERNKTNERERVLSESEVPKFWKAFDSFGLVTGAALKLILLTGQRPGEVAHMHRKHIVDGWWEMPGDPVPALNWPGTKNGASHRVWLPAPAQELLAEFDHADGLMLIGSRGAAINKLDAAMRTICATLGVERATPHDLRRTNGTTITGLGFGRDAMNRIQNHLEGGIASVYDQHEYAVENKRIMDTVAARITALADGTAPDLNVIEFIRKTT